MTPFSNNAIKASPEKIRQTASRASAICERMIVRMESVEHSVSESEFIWDSESAGLLYGYFEEDKMNYEFIKNALREKIELLSEIAALYEKAENDSGESAMALPNTVFL